MTADAAAVPMNDNDPEAEPPHTIHLFFENEERTIPLARDVLAAAHATMTPEEVAAHALDLAHLLALARWEAKRLYEDRQTAARMITKLHAGLQGCEDLRRANRKAEARKALAELTDVAGSASASASVMAAEGMLPWRNDIFNPYADRRMQ